MDHADAAFRLPLQLRDFRDILLRRKWVVLGTAAIILGAAVGISVIQSKTYESTVEVLVKPISNPFQSALPVGSQINLDTETKVASSVVVAQLAASKMHSTSSLSDLLSHLSVSVPTNTQILEIHFSAPTPLAAQRAADAFAAAYIEYKTVQTKKAIDDLKEPILNQIAQIRQQVQLLDTQIAARGVASPSQQSNHERLTAQLAVLESRLAPLDTILNDPGDIIQPASLPVSPASPKPAVNGAVGLFVGLTLGVGLALVRERLDDRIGGVMDLETHSATQVLAAIPKIQGRNKKDETWLSALAEPKGPVSEAYRTLRTSILALRTEFSGGAIMLTSPRSRAGKTTVAANLAIVLAQADRRVILVSADLRRPALDVYFGATNGAGLATVLVGGLSPSDALVRVVGNERLFVLPSGPVPENPAELLGSEGMREVIDHLRKIADFVILDSSPVLEVSDALALAPLVDGVLLVASAARTSRQEVAELRRYLDMVGGRVVGAVLNEYSSTRAGERTYYHPY